MFQSLTDWAGIPPGLSPHFQRGLCLAPVGEAFPGPSAGAGAAADPRKRVPRVKDASSHLGTAARPRHGLSPGPPFSLAAGSDQERGAVLWGRGAGIPRADCGYPVPAQGSGRWLFLGCEGSRGWPGAGAVGAVALPGTQPECLWSLQHPGRGGQRALARDGATVVLLGEKKNKNKGSGEHFRAVTPRAPREAGGPSRACAPLPWETFAPGDVVKCRGVRVCFSKK